MFSPIGGPQEDEQDIDWGDDLKFFIDNNDTLLNKEIFPAVKLQQQHQDHPRVHMVYIKPLKRCVEEYCKMFDVKNKEEIFTNEMLEEVARSICAEQQKHIEKGDYKKDASV